MQFSSSKGFKKIFKKLPKKIREQFATRIRIFLEDEYHPVLNNHRLAGEYEGCRSINITGDYRAVYQKRDMGSALFIDIGTHSQLYD